MAEWWQQRRWKALLELIEQLPSTSRYQQALAMDREAAERILAAERRADAEAEGETDPEWSPSLTEWTTEVTLLAEIRDMLPDLIQAVLSSIPRQKGKAAPRYSRPPFPRPKTALDEVRDELSLKAGRLLLELFFSGRGGG